MTVGLDVSGAVVPFLLLPTGRFPAFGGIGRVSIFDSLLLLIKLKWISSFS
jgi:hypothetical protein